MMNIMMLRFSVYIFCLRYKIKAEWHMATMFMLFHKTTPLTCYLGSRASFISSQILVYRCDQGHRVTHVHTFAGDHPMLVVGYILCLSYEPGPHWCKTTEVSSFYDVVSIKVIYRKEDLKSIWKQNQVTKITLRKACAYVYTIPRTLKHHIIELHMFICNVSYPTTYNTSPQVQIAVST